MAKVTDDDSANGRAEQARRGSPFLDTAQAAFFLGVSPWFMRKLRVDGTGPRFRMHCRSIRYHIDDLTAWSDARSHQVRPHG